MRRYLFFVACLLILSSVLGASHPDINALFTPSEINVNSFKTASFDPLTPWTQPIMTSLLISNTSDTDFRFYMKVEISWSGIYGPLVEAEYMSDHPIPAGGAYPVLTNQDLITSQASEYFHRVGSISFSLYDIINRSPLLRSAVLAGYFPDGTLSIKVLVQPESAGHADWTTASASVFDIIIRTAGTVYQLQPGEPVGTNPPRIGSNPVTYLWNSLDTGFNDYQLTILEFPEHNPPQPGSLTSTGRIFYQTSVSQYSFTEFLPYQPGNYYAWKIGTPAYSEADPALDKGSRRNEPVDEISGAWLVFQYIKDGADEDYIPRLLALLDRMNRPEIDQLLQNGYLPSGTVIWEGKTYSGQEAIDLLKGLTAKNLEVEIWHEGGGK